MDKKKSLILISAVVLGLISVVLLNFYLRGVRQATPTQKEGQPSEKQTRASGQAAKVLVAKANIRKGEDLQKGMFKEEAYPVEYMQPMAATAFEEIEGKIALLPISKGEQLLLSKIGTYEEEVASLSFSMRVPKGKRAVTVVVDSIAAAGGMAKAGDYVDVFCNLLVSEEVDGKSQENVATVPLFQNILVLQANDLAAEAARKKTTASSTGVSITLALFPQEAGVLLYAEQRGKLSFLLRSPADEQKSDVFPVNTETFYQFIAPNVPQKQSMPSQTKVEVFKGIKQDKK